MKREDLMQYLTALLQPAKFKDYCPNGLQVEGTGTISKIITGVTASQDLIDAAIEQKADAILVHHGYFWRGENECITGIKKKRIQALLANNINLIAYHLPLDNHSELGNNVQLAKVLDLTVETTLDPNDPSVPGLIGRLPRPMSADAFSAWLGECLKREPLHLGPDSSDVIETIAWCTGGAQGYMQYAIDAGVDVYLTGEVSEQNQHLAVETGTHFFAAGHHATERYGARALGQHLAKKFELDVNFIDIDNPA
ncbi:MAG TPA: Nif3-like dinuclear metal center hexameric protein [Oceanospirillales bacterium]|nr:Nif3-like dinuclear metal center hexameric protein [Oleispira sp.]HCM05544.1 Nif3-like dinuclear metal center hexameric protein [Oceanospirillales bacterium]